MSGPLNPEQNLILLAASVQRMAPQQWLAFVKALATYSQNVSTNCIMSPLENLPVAQGRAQATAHLLDLFANCLAAADKIEGRSK